MKARHLVALLVVVCSQHPAFAQFVQQGPKLVGTGYFKLGGSVFQGVAVSLSADGNTAIIGGSGDNFSTGGVWIWTRSGGVWTQQSPKLVGTGAAEGSTEGNAVAISADGNTAIVGAAGDDRDAFDNHHGSAWIWTRSGNLWTQQGPKLVGSDAAGAAQQGTSVAISADGNTVIIGGSSDNGSLGASWIWARSAGVWSQQGPKLVASDSFGPAKQGWSVSLSADGNTAIVGGFLDHNNDGGAWIWTRSGGVWSQQGPRLFGSGATVNPRQGTSVAISADGNTAIVGGYLDNNQGAAWIWTRSGGVWTQQGSKLVGSGAVGNAAQGTYVAISGDGNTALVGGPSDNNLAGAVWVWKRNAGIWTQQGTKLVGAGAVGTVVEQGAVSISSDGRTAIVGGPLDDGGFGFATGAAWVFAAATADLTITKSHTGNFHQGDSGDTYLINVFNAGTGATTGAVVVSDTLPAGLTPTAPNGAAGGWSCSINGQTLTCTRSDVIAASTGFPPIIVSVNVASNAPHSVINTASVSGGGESNTANDTASDPTTIVSPSIPAPPGNRHRGVRP
jgi:uncharacterized repeat protein (TIGR01451 family)